MFRKYMQEYKLYCLNCNTIVNRKLDIVANKLNKSCCCPVHVIPAHAVLFHNKLYQNLFLEESGNLRLSGYIKDYE